MQCLPRINAWQVWWCGKALHPACEQLHALLHACASALVFRVSTAWPHLNDVLGAGSQLAQLQFKIFTLPRLASAWLPD